ITAGPAMPIASPEPRNRPVPRAEPMAIIAIWPWPRDRARLCCSAASGAEEGAGVFTRTRIRVPGLAGLEVRRSGPRGAVRVDRGLRLDQARAGVLAVRLHRLDDPPLGDEAAALLGDRRQRLLADPAQLGLVQAGALGELVDEALEGPVPGLEGGDAVCEALLPEHAHDATRCASRSPPPKVAEHAGGGRAGQSPRTDPVRGDARGCEALRPSRRPWRRSAGRPGWRRCPRADGRSPCARRASGSGSRTRRCDGRCPCRTSPSRPRRPPW